MNFELFWLLVLTLLTFGTIFLMAYLFFNKKDWFIRTFKNYWLMFIIFFITYLFIAICISYHNFYLYLFDSSDHKFQWVGATSIVAIITLGFNAWDSRRKYKADLISKSRIKWMDTVRNLISNYYADISKYMFLYNKWVTTSDANEDNKKERQKIYTEFTELMSDIKINYYNIILYVSNNNSNDKVLRNINLLWCELSYIVLYYNKQIEIGKINNVNEISDVEMTVDNYISELINSGIKDASEYFKIEWERAKRGE